MLEVKQAVCRIEGRDEEEGGVDGEGKRSHGFCETARRSASCNNCLLSNSWRLETSL